MRLRDRGPDYRGFVQLPFVQDEHGNLTNHCAPEVIASASQCHVESCARNTQVCASNPFYSPSSNQHILLKYKKELFTALSTGIV